MAEQDLSKGTFGVPYERINKATTDVIRAESGDIGISSKQSEEALQSEIARYGGEGFQTGAFAGATADIIRQRNEAVANIVGKYSLQRESVISNREMQLQNMIAQGYVDPATGNLLRSAYTMDLERMDKQFQYQMELQDKKNQGAMFGGLGQLAGMAVGGIYGMVAG